jgi:hypothetical protein
VNAGARIKVDAGAVGVHHRVVGLLLGLDDRTTRIVHGFLFQVVNAVAGVDLRFAVQIGDEKFAGGILAFAL